MSSPLVARTPHLELVAATVDHFTAEISGPQALGALLGVAVPEGWPPGEHDRMALEFFKAQLAAAGESAAGWYSWYAITLGAGDHRESLVGSGGYRGPPDDDGKVEIGYSVMPAARRRGYATEMVGFLLARAFRFHPVQAVIADTLESNCASANVLLRCGFAWVGQGSEPGTTRYMVCAPGSTWAEGYKQCK